MYAPYKFRPKLLDCLKTYNIKTMGSDLSAGVTVGIIALPMAMAFAIGSGVKPEAGIITAVLAGCLASLFGGTKVSISGPTGAFVGIVSGIVASYGISGLLICTIMAGILLILMGLVRLGGLIRYIPATLIRGFTTGIAVIILCGQLRDFLGITSKVDTSNLLSTFTGLIPQLHEIHPPTTIIGIISIAIIIFWPRRFSRYVPGSITAMLLVTGLVTALAPALGISIETIDSRYGGIPQALPLPQLPDFDLTIFQKLLSPALTIALLGAIESLLCATAADGMTNDEHNPDQELVAQGIANLVTPLFGGLPATGAIVRTAANIRNGGKTPVSGIVHSLTLLLIMLLLAPFARFIPLAVLSGVLIMIAINMGDWREFARLSRYPRSDAIVFMLTFVITIIFGLTQAVFVGMFVACLLFVRGISKISQVGVRLGHHHEQASNILAEQTDYDRWYVAEADASDDILLVTMTGAMFFGAAKKLKGLLQLQHGQHKVVIMRMGQVISLDATALFTLEEIIDKFTSTGIPVILVALREQPMRTMHRAGLLGKLPPENVVPNLEVAMFRADEIIDAGERICDAE